MQAGARIKCLYCGTRLKLTRDSSDGAIRDHIEAMVLLHHRCTPASR